MHLGENVVGHIGGGGFIHLPYWDSNQNTLSGSMSKPLIVYFSSTTNNTHRFVEKLGFESVRLPLRQSDPRVSVGRPYVLVTPTYGGGRVKGAVPKQVIQFLNDPANRGLCVGVIASGNTNFGEAYALAGHVISQKLGVPFMYRFELMGLPEDVERVREGVVEFWGSHISR